MAAEMNDQTPDVTATVAEVDPSAESMVARLRQRLELAAPRLEAFERLEHLARERRSTPEAVAVQVTIDVLEEERGDLEAEIEEFRVQKAALQAENETILAERESALDDVAEARAEYERLADQVSELIDEIESIRSDAVRLMGEKAALDVRVGEFHREIADLSEQRDAVAPKTSNAIEQSDDPDEEHAFDKFFQAEHGKDKARAWMLK